MEVTDGIGLIQARGGPVTVIRPGDVIQTPPNEWHWHGAAPTNFMVHTAIWEAPPDPTTPETDWGDHVTPDEYVVPTD